MEIGSLRNSKFAPGNRREKRPPKKETNETSSRLQTIQPSGVLAASLPETSSKSTLKMYAWKFDPFLLGPKAYFPRRKCQGGFCCLASPRGDSTPLMEICDAKKNVQVTQTLLWISRVKEAVYVESIAREMIKANKSTNKLLEMNPY